MKATAGGHQAGRSAQGVAGYQWKEEGAQGHGKGASSRMSGVALSGARPPGGGRGWDQGHGRVASGRLSGAALGGLQLAGGYIWLGIKGTAAGRQARCVVQRLVGHGKLAVAG